MRRTTLNFTLDLLAFIDLLLLAATGATLRWVLPPGSGGGHGPGQGAGFRGGRGPVEVKELLGLGRHDWGGVHFVLALLFLILMLVHLSLHWTWITTCGKSVLLPSHRKACDREDGPARK